MLSEPEMERGDDCERLLAKEPAAGRRLQVAIVDEELCYPPNSGKRIRTLNLLRPLARRHDITYLAYRGEDAAETRAAADFLAAEGIRPVLVDRVLPSKAGPEFYARLMLNLLSPLPYSVQVHNSRTLREAIRRVAREQSIDLWQCEWTPYGESLVRAASGPWVTMAHNVESVIWRRYAEYESNFLKRGYIRVQHRKFERFERRMFALADRTITVSPPDAQIALSNWGLFFDDVMHDPSRYGIENTTDKCAGRAIFDEDTTPCQKPSAYFYYHGGHPSTAVHKVVGDKLYEEVTVAK